MQKSVKQTKSTKAIKVISVIQLVLAAMTAIISYGASIPGQSDLAYATFFPFGLYIILGIVNMILFLKYILIKSNRSNVDVIAVQLFATNVTLVLGFILFA